ncbi:hypothetical protein SAMN05660429_02932 [Thalassotalea agarivorans]|uniref:Uncharacterized protein n=1 Tax=Thalassotalea agarivorans TaxID=349064 RepID=A0A1I0HUL6_THASX|nr:hypothetical protein SAMN05660429_02932 [Thalassotalea agarivorans]
MKTLVVILLAIAVHLLVTHFFISSYNPFVDEFNLPKLILDVLVFVLICLIINGVWSFITKYFKKQQS